jgi:hypothetical protein
MVQPIVEWEVPIERDLEVRHVAQSSQEFWEERLLLELPWEAWKQEPGSLFEVPSFMVAPVVIAMLPKMALNFLR